MIYQMTWSPLVLGDEMSVDEMTCTAIISVCHVSFNCKENERERERETDRERERQTERDLRVLRPSKEMISTLLHCTQYFTCTKQ